MSFIYEMIQTFYFLDEIVTKTYEKFDGNAFDGNAFTMRLTGTNSAYLTQTAHTAQTAICQVEIQT